MLNGGDFFFGLTKSRLIFVLKENYNLSQYNWTYVGGGGRNFTVTLFHGKRTGHVLILLNAQVVQIDFSVRESKTYSFFIEDEFCQIRLERRGEEMYYFFEIDKKVDTPRNRARKKQERRYLIQVFVFFGFLVALASGTALGIQAYNKKLKTRQMSATMYTSVTIGWVEVDTLHPSSLVRYYYVVGNMKYSGSSYLDSVLTADDPVIPLAQGDEFTVRYNPDYPEFSKIFFPEYTGPQKLRYLDRTLQRHLELNPAIHPSLARCMLELALEREGAEGLADFFYQNAEPSANPLHNKDSYHRLVRDPVFQREVEKRCWN